MKQRGKYILAALILCSAFIFVFKPEWLTISLFKNPTFPLGTIISWLLIFMYSLLMYLSIPLKIEKSVERFMKIAMQICLIMAAFWGIVSFLVAENWSFIFEDITRFYIWISYSGIIVLLPFVVLIILGIRKIFGLR